VPLPKTISEQCNKLKIVVKEHNVIYHLVDSIKAELEARLPDKHDEHELGSGRVLQEFRVSLSGRKLPVAGTKVERGTLILSPTALFRITRAGAIVYEGEE
jgi:translation initiation factor IF-2